MNSRVRSWRACLAFYLKASAVCPFMLLGSFLYTRPAPLFFLGVCLFSGFTGAGGRKRGATKHQENSILTCMRHSVLEAHARPASPLPSLVLWRTRGPPTLLVSLFLPHFSVTPREGVNILEVCACCDLTYSFTLRLDVFCPGCRGDGSRRRGLALVSAVEVFLGHLREKIDSGLVAFTQEEVAAPFFRLRVFSFFGSLSRVASLAQVKQP